MSWLIGKLAGGVFGKFFGFLNKRGERQSNLDIAGIESTKDSWKDEFITAVILFPLILINFAALLAVLSQTWSWAQGTLDTSKVPESHQMIDSVIYSISAIGQFPEFYQNFLYITITAGLGLYALAKGGKMIRNRGGNGAPKREADVFKTPK